MPLVHLRFISFSSSSLPLPFVRAPLRTVRLRRIKKKFISAPIHRHLRCVRAYLMMGSRTIPFQFDQISSAIAALRSPSGSICFPYFISISSRGAFLLFLVGRSHFFHFAYRISRNCLYLNVCYNALAQDLCSARSRNSSIAPCNLMAAHLSPAPIRFNHRSQSIRRGCVFDHKIEFT